MKRTTRTQALALAVLALSIAAVGCTKPPKWKDDVANALTKQAEITQYAFAGEADLNVGLPAPAADANAATSTLISLFSTSKISWNGLTSANPLRLEADYKLTPGGSSASFTLPVLFKDNLIYMSVPLLNKSGEYFSFDPAKLAGVNQEAQTVDGLKNVNKAMSESVKQLMEDFDATWFKKDKETVALKEGGEGTVIRMAVTEKNRDAVTEKLKAKLPAVIDGWKTNGILSSAQSEKLKTGASGTWSVTGGELSFTLDEQGYIRKETVNIDYSAGSNAERHIHYTQSFDGLNQAPAFQKETPKTVRPFEDVLKLLQAQNKSNSTK
ncbi:hypothetical protein [Gorillibacterium timonense]|uniref:hypothetical protein n=1 Tax=Gorillibacterium timonense TaxID=1689269 RepID=UPI00071C6B03|nr:hypothetical protein [Gorillibacterium timonense]